MSAPRRSLAAPLVERIERALVLAAYVVVRHGPAYAPLLDRLEQELEAARRNDPTERAKCILAAYPVDEKQMSAGVTSPGLGRTRSRAGAAAGRRLAQYKDDTNSRS